MKSFSIVAIALAAMVIVSCGSDKTGNDKTADKGSSYGSGASSGKDSSGYCSDSMQQDSRDTVTNMQSTVDKAHESIRKGDKAGAIYLLHQVVDQCNAFVNKYGVDFQCVESDTGERFYISDIKTMCESMSSRFDQM